MINLTDFIFLILLSLSAVLGFSKGLIHELLSLAIWVVAIFITLTYVDDLALVLTPHIRQEDPRFAAAVALLFLPTLIVLSVLNRQITKFFLRGGPDSHDHLFGLVFGTLRGALIIMVMVLLGGTTSQFSRQQWWVESRVISYTLPVLASIRPYLSEDIGHYIDVINRPAVTRAITLQADVNGHYNVQGAINDHPVTLLVDTGASLVSIPAHIAAQIGLQPSAQEDIMMTAAGRQKVARVTLRSVQIGNIVLNNVEGAILPTTESDAILLGMSFLRGLSFKQSEHTLELEQKVR